MSSKDEDFLQDEFIKRDSKNKIILPSLKENILKTIIENIIFAKTKNENEEVIDGVTSFCSTLMKEISPCYFWPYLSFFEKTDDSVLQKAERNNNCALLLKWIKKAQKKHIKNMDLIKEKKLIKFLKYFKLFVLVAISYIYCKILVLSFSNEGSNELYTERYIFLFFFSTFYLCIIV